MSTAPVAVTFEYKCPNYTLKDFLLSDPDTTDEDKIIQINGHQNDDGVFQPVHSEESNTSVSMPAFTT